jgi:hypothetical protein
MRPLAGCSHRGKLRGTLHCGNASGTPLLLRVGPISPHSATCAISPHQPIFKRPALRPTATQPAWANLAPAVNTCVRLVRPQLRERPPSANPHRLTPFRVTNVSRGCGHSSAPARWSESVAGLNLDARPSPDLITLLPADVVRCHAPPSIANELRRGPACGLARRRSDLTTRPAKSSIARRKSVLSP